MLDNLDTFILALNMGAKPQQVRYKFIHPEGCDVLAITQKGKAGVKPSRLYIYPDESTEIVHGITLGDKSTQTADVALCHEFVQELHESEAPNG